MATDLQYLAFGIELEILVAFERPDIEVPVPAAGSNKFVTFQYGRFPFGMDEPDAESDISYKHSYWAFGIQNSIMEHMGDILAEAGFPSSLHRENPTCWTIKDDSSVRRVPVESDEFWYVGLEITTPVLSFNTEALEHIQNVVELLNSKSVIDVNSSCGFHVHLSAGLKTPLPFPTLKRLVMFLWDFESQLDSLHPPERSMGEYAKSWRLCSRFSVLFYDKWGISPSVLDGLVELEKAKDSTELIMMLNTNESTRFQAYNLQTLRLFLNPGSKPFGNMQRAMETIEFRQHETLNTERISNWVRLIGEVTQTLGEMLEREFQILLQKVKLETWEKRGWAIRRVVLPKKEKPADKIRPTDENCQTTELVIDRSEDSEKDFRLGKIAAESTFTIIDLLRHLDLNDLADYYQTQRLHDVVGKSQRKHTRWQDWVWAYEIRYTKSGDKLLEAISKLSKAEANLSESKDEVLQAKERVHKAKEYLSENQDRQYTTESYTPEEELEVLKAEHNKASTRLDDARIELDKAEAQVKG